MSSENFGSVSRKSLIYAAIIIAFGLILLKLVHLQVLNYEEYDQRSAGNSIKGIEQIPLRGVFYDRNQEIIVSNIPAYTLRITPSYYKPELNSLLDKVLEVDSGYVGSVLERNKIYSKYMPVKIKRGIDFKVVAWLEENSEYLPGVDYIVEMRRGYPADIMGSHMFGYTKEISPTQLKKEEDFYNPGDYVGHNGIEKMYEKNIRGVKGYKYVLVDSKRMEIGKYQNGSQDVESIKGNDLILSIDADVQRVAEQEMEGKRGAIVAIEPKTGEVLALVSAPDYDLNEFANVTSREFLTELFNNPDKPSFNRATMSLKPPGSTFKMLSAFAALDLGVITPQTTIFCGGGFTFGRFFRCHGSHGSVNVSHALEKSCNTFFYQLIYKIGLDKWTEYCDKFNFGKITGIDIGEESKGLIPDTKYYEKQYGQNWPRSIMASLGIGQGEVSVTPLQLAVYTALIANNGKTFKPHIVKGHVLPDRKQFVPYTFEEINTGIKQSVFDVVKNGMYLVVHGAGTATGLKVEEYTTAGKTGTAQNPHGKDHALFVGFAPYENPKIAVCVVVENVGFGGTHAAPVAKKLFEAYLMKDIKQQDENNILDDEQIAGVTYAR